MATGKVHNLLPAFIATVLLATPAAVLPCRGGHCGRADVVAKDGAIKHCCCGVAGADAPTTPAGDDHSHQGGGPCDCPPGCPAPCSMGKLPCPPVDTCRTTTVPVPMGMLPEPVSAPAPDAIPDGVFHPPRV